MRKSSLTLFSVIILTSLLLSACGSSAPAATAAPGDQKLSGTITVSGAFALYPMMTVWADEFTKLHPDVQFDVQGGGAGKGMTDTLAGAVDIGMISRSVKPEEEAKGAFWVPVAKDAVFPVVSQNNPVAADLIAKGISKETFKKIFITRRDEDLGRGSWQARGERRDPRVHPIRFGRGSGPMGAVLGREGASGYPRHRRER